ncbi:MAG: SDR family oxidoreductase [Gammaproteobacteria bacterium]
MDVNLDGRQALVCGGSRGIGQACARALAEQGAMVTVAARSEQKLVETVESLTHPERGHGYLVVDFGAGDALRATLEAFAQRAGPVAILINNSGGPPPGPAHGAAPDAFASAFAQHLIGNQIAVQALLPGMKAGGYGRIVNIISTSVKEPIAGLGVSNTIRGAVASWAKTLASELGPFGITVNNVLPGFTRTERLAALFAGRAEKQSRPVADIEDEARRSVPLGRFAEPDEIAAAVAFLASPAASYINGINLPVDGGRTGSL